MDSARSPVRVGSPEGLRYDWRASVGIGRDARLDLAFERRGERTVVAHAYAEPPFRIGRTFALDDAVYLIIVCAGPGVLGGDVLRQSVRVGRGARVVLTSQAALQVHPAANRAPALLDHHYAVDDGAELHCHWDPIIPFADSRLEQRIDLHLSPTARLCWGDALMAGRLTRGEAWRFQELSHELRLRVGDTVRYLERYRVRPGECAPLRTWIAGDAGYFATMLVHDEAVSSGAAEAMHTEIAALEGVRAAVDCIERDLLLARLTAARGVPFAAARAECRRLALERILESPQLLGRKSV